MVTGVRTENDFPFSKMVIPSVSLLGYKIVVPFSGSDGTMKDLREGSIFLEVQEEEK